MNTYISNSLFTSVILSFVLTFIPQSLFASSHLKVNCFWPAEHLVCQKILPNWLSAVKKATQGRVTGSVLPESAFSPPEQVVAVENGLVDVAVQFNGFIPSRATGALVAMMPFVATNDARAMSSALWLTNRKYFSNELSEVHLLSQWVISPAELYSQTHTPINSMAELSKRTIWSLPGVLEGIMIQATDSVVAMPPVRAHEVISTGVVNAYVGLDPGDVSEFGLFPYTKSMTRFKHNIYASSFSFMMNDKIWLSLSEQDKVAISNVSGDAFARMAAGYWQDTSEKAMSEFAKYNVTVINANPKFEAELKALTLTITQEWIESADALGIDGQAAYDFYKAKVLELSN
jgi:TRAP-type C4-dicarboxylate transport system substrate-binding protein